MRKGHQARAQVEQALVGSQVQQTILAHRDELQAQVFLGGQDMPGHQVGVVLHLGQDNHIARPQVGPPPGVGHQVDRLGGVACVDHLARGRRMDKAGDLARASSYNAVASSASTWMPRWMLALELR